MLTILISTPALVAYAGGAIASTGYGVRIYLRRACAGLNSLT